MATSSTPPETTCKFTPEQRQRLGQVYAMILRWNREDDLLRAQQASQTFQRSGTVQESVALAEIKSQEG